MRLRGLALTVHGIALASAAGCGGGVTERDQWTVWITTDVPVPTVADRALVEVLDTDGSLACTECRRMIGLPASPSSWPISFGVVVPPSRSAPRVRVRLHQAARVGSDEAPPVATTIDRLAKLPPARGNVDVALVLRGECAGIGASVAEGLSCGDVRELVDEVVLPVGRPDATIVPGTWPRGARIECTGEPDEDMVCVPGGLFVLGDPIQLDVGRLRVMPERFVTVAPFALDREEVKVGAVRALVASGKISTEPEARSTDPTALFSECTYLGRASAENDRLPVNCIDHTLAAKVCAATGKRLPTEVEWEWAAGNLEEETPHPWGYDGDACSWSDVGLATDLFSVIEGSSVCRTRPGRSSLPAAVPAKGNPRDRTRLGLMALGGGVSEWVADRAANYDEACWRPDEPFLDNPRCDAGSSFSIRGSSWVGSPGFARVTLRQSAPAAFRDPSVGLRCARSE